MFIIKCSHCVDLTLYPFVSVIPLQVFASLSLVCIMVAVLSTPAYMYISYPAEVKTVSLPMELTMSYAISCKVMSLTRTLQV